LEKFNYYRKAWHLLGFIVPIILYFDLLKGSLGLVHATKAITFTGVLLFLLVVVLTDILRLYHAGFRSLYMKLLGKLMKEGESHRFNGTVPYMISNAFVILFFPSEIVFLSMMYLLIGDPSAAFFGSKYGGYRFYNGKSLIGIVGFIISTLVFGTLLLALFYFTHPESIYGIYYNGIFNVPAIVLIAIGSICAGLTEFFSGHAWMGIIDDNLTIPVISSLVIVGCSIVIFSMDSNYLIFKVSDLYKF